MGRIVLVTYVKEKNRKMLRQLNCLLKKGNILAIKNNESYGIGIKSKFEGKRKSKVVSEL